MEERPRNRPKGSGYTTISIRKRDDNPGYRVFLGRAVWQAMGCPRRFRIEDVGERCIAFIPTDDDTGWAVSNGETNGRPWLSVGAATVNDWDVDHLIRHEIPASLVDDRLLCILPDSV